MPKVKDTAENAAICLTHCKPCLSYPNVEGEALFCARGKSTAPKSKKGCNCGYCEVQKSNGCRGAYYCINGPCE